MRQTVKIWKDYLHKKHYFMVSDFPGAEPQHTQTSCRQQTSPTYTLSCYLSEKWSVCSHPAAAAHLGDGMMGEIKMAVYYHQGNQTFSTSWGWVSLVIKIMLLSSSTLQGCLMRHFRANFLSRPYMFCVIELKCWFSVLETAVWQNKWTVSDAWCDDRKSYMGGNRKQVRWSLFRGIINIRTPIEDILVLMCSAVLVGFTENKTDNGKINKR